jgi:hypothetical protein
LRQSGWKRQATPVHWPDNYEPLFEEEDPPLEDEPMFGHGPWDPLPAGGADEPDGVPPEEEFGGVLEDEEPDDELEGGLEEPGAVDDELDGVVVDEDDWAPDTAVPRPMPSPSVPAPMPTPNRIFFKDDVMCSPSLWPDSLAEAGPVLGGPGPAHEAKQGHLRAS